ncbi:MAG: 5-formyltetrahydrofolate cyclo-ligase [Collinsella aerofaciens]
MRLSWMCGRRSPPLSVRGLLSDWVARIPRHRTPLPSMPRWVPKSILPRLPRRPPNATGAWPIRACSRQPKPQLVASACACGQLLSTMRPRLRLSPTPRGPSRPWTSTATSSLSCLADVLDMIIVPLVAFDQTGARLGYGGGCYDRYLPTLSATCQIIGIAFDEQRVNHVPTNAHDLPLPHIISA